MRAWVSDASICATWASSRLTTERCWAGSIWMRNWPFLTRSSLTPIWVIRPVMSALTSTLVSASILPLAVTAATRSRAETGSSRTSVARLPFGRRQGKEAAADHDDDREAQRPSAT